MTYWQCSRCLRFIGNWDQLVGHLDLCRVDVEKEISRAEKATDEAWERNR